MDIKTRFNIGDCLFVEDCKCECEDFECDTCDGKGEVEIKGERFKCPNCKGDKVLSLVKRTYSVKKGVIKSIHIMVDEKGEMDISYNVRIEHRGNVFSYDEKRIDDTNLKKSKAEKKCEKLNSEADWERF